MTEIQKRLFALQDGEYRAFQCKLMPTVPPERVIGVRTPQLRELAKELFAEGCEDFIAALPHEYYDEYNLHGFVLCLMRDYEKCVAEIERFLPYVDNWATCDLIRPKAFDKTPEKLILDIKRWMRDERPFTVRFGMEMLMTFFLDSRFRPEYLELAAAVRSEEYYVNMMSAWFFATALAKQYEAALPYIEERRLEQWVHNKTIQKACESRRVSEERKAHLKTLKI